MVPDGNNHIQGNHMQGNADRLADYTNSALARKHQRMEELIAEMRSVAVAFSAGVDSTLVLKVALDVLGRDNVVAITGRSASLARAELEHARRLAEYLGAEHVLISTDEFDDGHYTANPTNRCYYCKTELYRKMARVIGGRSIDWIVNGANVDDLSDWRPGLKAAAEHRVRAPAAEAGLTKAEVRALSRRLGLNETWDTPASPCLSSRVPYGQAVTPRKLRMIEAGERFLRERFGLRECRVRHYGDEARLEVPLADLPRVGSEPVRCEIEHVFHDLGFATVTLDDRGFRSGSLNDVIAFGKPQADATHS